MKRYGVSRQLDVEVSYFVTKTDNLRFHAQEENDMELLDKLEERFEKLLSLQEDVYLGNDGIFTVSSRNYLLAVECRDLYRIRHQLNRHLF